MIEESRLEHRLARVGAQLAQVAQIVVGEAQLADVLERRGQSGGDGETGLERRPAEEEVEDRLPIFHAGLPRRRGHGELVEVRQQRERLSVPTALRAAGPCCASARATSAAIRSSAMEGGTYLATCS